MVPYNALDLVRVMRYEMTPEDERRHGAHIARDIRRDEDRPEDGDTPNKGERFSLRPLFLSALSVARGL
ncbi:MAG TPA: hypothetical protein VH482_15395 [Thermomicrobiales bacterium]|jgi:hypothetical protein